MYYPRPVPADQLQQFLDVEHRAIAEAISSPVQFLILEKQFVTPKKLREGMTVLFDSTAPDAASGTGVYTYHSGGWQKLG